MANCSDDASLFTFAFLSQRGQAALRFRGHGGGQHLSFRYLNPNHMGIDEAETFRMGHRHSSMR